MASSIQNLLDQILNAVYGEEVRGAIHDSIEQCYSDVSTAKTSADTAVSNANTAIANANIATASANSAATSANSAATSATNAASAANDAAETASGAQAIIDRWNGDDGEPALSTTINNAINSATGAASSANSAASTANTAASTANTAASNANSAAQDTQTVINNAQGIIDRWNGDDGETGLYETITDAIDSATDAAENATDATTNAQAIVNRWNGNDGQTALSATINSAISNANGATSNAQAIANRWNGTDGQTALSTTINNAISNANGAATNATNAISGVNEWLANTNTVVETALNDISDAKSACEQATYGANSAAENTRTATTRATTAAQSIEGLTTHANTIAPGTNASAEVSDVGTHKNIEFYIPKGDPGEPFKILGDAYASVNDLAAAVPNPNEGDMYNVGSQPPYTLYRWTGTVWEDQGTIVPTLDPISDGDVDTVWDGDRLQVTRYLTSSGLYYLVNSKVLTALSGKVDKETGKVLSSNDFTNEYIQAIGTNTSNISVLSSTKVDKVETSPGSGQYKVLSTNDYTTAEKTKLAGIAEGANCTVTDNTLSSSSTNPIQNQAVAAAVNTINTALDNGSLQLASAYITDSSQKSYIYGEYCIYNRVLYRCTNAYGASGSFNPNHWTAVTMIDAVANSNLYISVPAFSSLPLTINNSAITAEHVVGQVALSNPDAQVEAWNVSTAAGSATISGTIAGSTTLGLLLTKAKTIQSVSS